MQSTVSVAHAINLHDFPIYGGCVCVPDRSTLETDSVHCTQVECLLGGSFNS